MDLRLRVLRKQHHMTQTELGRAIGASMRVVSAWEREETSLPLEDAARIADLFNCTLDELAGREWPKAPPAHADARLARINEQYAEMNERGKVRATESVDDIHANPQNRAGVSPEAEAVGGVRRAG